MSATHDNSVLFSLNQLMELHETRVQEEEAEAARKAEAEQKARELALRQEQELLARKALEEAERKARNEATVREEQARLEAMKLAAIERARVEAEKQAQLEMQVRAGEHVRALEAMREDEKKKRLTRAIWTGVLCGAVVLVGGVGLYFGKMKPDHETLLTQQAADINAQFEVARRIEAQNESNRKRITQAESLLEQAKRSAEEQQRNAAVPKDQAPRPWVNTTKTQPKSQAKSSACLPGEPGCDLNGNRIF